MARSIILCHFMASLGHVDAMLVANRVGFPQNLATVSGVDVCANRSAKCNVLLDVPSKCAGSKSACPVLFCLHGMGGSNLPFIDMCGSPVHAHGFIGVYPQGDPFYNTERPCWNGLGERCQYNDYSCTLDPNDGLFFERLAGALQFAGSTGHLYAYGQSNGAAFSQRLGANAGPKLPFAGIAPQSGQLMSKPLRSGAGPYNLNRPMPNHPPVAQLSIHGTEDGRVPYDGGRFQAKSDFPSDFGFLSEPDSNKVWAEHNGCTGTVTSTNVSAQFHMPPGLESGIATHHVYGGCPGHAPVEWFETHGAGHVGTTNLSGKPLLDTVLNFFARVESALAIGAFSQPLVI